MLALIDSHQNGDKGGDAHLSHLTDLVEPDEPELAAEEVDVTVSLP